MCKHLKTTDNATLVLRRAELSGETCGDDRPQMPEAMHLLNSLPDSIKGCLLEAARLCGSSAGLAQKNLLNQWHMQVCCSPHTP